VAYQTAYLKAHYPSEYMAAVLNHAGSIDKITFFMEECKRMGIRVLGPDVNESLKGFAVNSRGEIRFGLGGLKGAGDVAVDSVINERKQNGPYKDIFDFIKRSVSRSVNKKSLESFAYSGAFDCFPQLHRAQYFNIPDGEKMSGLEKIIGYGQVTQNISTGTTNTLFGDLPSEMNIPTPKIAPCEEWTLTEKLGYEKDVTGMFMSGHPLDHFKFEMKYYGIMQLSDFNEVKESNTLMQSNAGKPFRIAGLVIDAQHRTTKTGRSFGILAFEDLTGKTELALFGEDYMKFQHYLDKGKNIMVNGFFKQGWKPDTYEFKVGSITLLETAKQSLTKSIEINLHPTAISGEFVEFISSNVRNNPGKTSLKFNVIEPRDNLKISMYTTDKGFTMNEDMAEFLLNNLDIEINVGLTA